MLQLEQEFHESWEPIMKLLYREPLKTLNERVLLSISYQPSIENVFKVFSMPVSDIKVVILGQDPYPTPGNAIGRAFAVSEDTKIPTSLRNIAFEVARNMKIEGDNLSIVDKLKPQQYFSNIDLYSEWRTLDHWQEQGIFLLNTALTVETGKAGSHLNYWKEFTGNVLNFITHQNQQAIFVLWGKKAQAFKPWLYGDTNILEAPHPAAEAYSGGKAGFYGCKHFVKINEILVKQNKTPINW